MAFKMTTIGAFTALALSAAPMASAQAVGDVFHMEDGTVIILTEYGYVVPEATLTRELRKKKAKRFDFFGIVSRLDNGLFGRTEEKNPGWRIGTFR